MPNSRRQRAKRARAEGRKAQTLHLPPAPGLFKETVTLTDTVEMVGSTYLTNGFNVAYLSANGYSNPDLVGTYQVPQARIWNQYAAMYDFYQVEGVHMEFYPYKWETTTSLTGVANVNARPIYSCVDPESVAPTTSSGIASYGNLHVTPAYAVHKRSLPYTMLGIQKQQTVILATNGAAQSRAQYTAPAQIAALIQCPNFGTNPIGTLVFSIKYVFSGRRAPNVNVPKPLSVKQSDASQVSEVSQPQDPEQIMQQAYKDLLMRMSSKDTGIEG